MKSNFISIKNNNKYVYVALILIIFFTLFRLIFLFINNKQGHHSDEAWSYGFANSYYDPYDYLDIHDDIFLDNATEKNINEWVSGNYFYDYIIVNKGEEFSYGSVVYNKLGDNSPSLYELILHTISSVFQGKFSWWFGFSINILCYVFIEILLFNISLSISDSKIFSLFVILFYGFSRAALNTILYVRMYALLTLITLALIYVVNILVKKNYKNCSLEQLLIMLLIFLGGFTHFYALIFDCFFALVFSIVLIAKKQWRHLVTIAGTFLGGAFLYIIIYPFGIMRIFSGQSLYSSSVRWPYRIELELLVNFIFRDCFGINYSYDVFDLLDTFIIIALLFILWLVCHFLFRKDNWMKKIAAKEKNILSNAIHFKYAKVFYNWFVKQNFQIVILIISSILTILVVAKFSNITGMMYYSDRYVFNIMPEIILALLYTLYKLAKFLYKILHNKISNIKIKRFIPYLPFGFFLIIAIFFTVRSMTGLQVYYFYQGTDNFNLENYLKDKNVIILEDSAWRLEWYCTELYESENVFMTGHNYDDEVISKIANLKSDSDYVLLLPEEAEDYSITTYGSTSENIIESESSSQYNSDPEDNSYNEFLSEVSDALDNEPEYITTISTFCGTLDIYLIKNN